MITIKTIHLYPFLYIVFSLYYEDFDQFFEFSCTRTYQFISHNRIERKIHTSNVASVQCTISSQQRLLKITTRDTKHP